ncbi:MULTISPECIES: GNAT family acetyltransferase [unclassified Paraburkholderia]|uniref:GNAT family acetyltransferase n=1 Tax=unclassified Paraburkholderia TaxID=2615204 RepID=UPI002AB04464|nr:MULTISPECIES: GNAT family acetyltransferase [unclassified Paraburkholderia]
MITLEKLDVHHVVAVGAKLQTAQQTTIQTIDEDYARTLIANKGVAWAVVEDGEPIACGGIAEAWTDRAIAWSMITPRAFRYFPRLHRLVKRVLDESPWVRIEIDVRADHAAGCRWADHLGFIVEGIRRKYTPDGADMILYARVK